MNNFYDKVKKHILHIFNPGKCDNQVSAWNWQEGVNFCGCFQGAVQNLCAKVYFCTILFCQTFKRIFVSVLDWRKNSEKKVSQPLIKVWFTIGIGIFTQWNWYLLNIH